MTLRPEEIKACCARAYASDAALVLLGDSFHPGGAELTSRLIRALGVSPGRVVVDVASGPGTSALQLARETGCGVIGVDLSPESVAAASVAAAAAGLDGRVRFAEGDAEALPLDDASVDGALCECALCMFPDQDAAAREIWRVLRPGARLALSDVVAEPMRLPPELRSIEAWVACVGAARPLEELVATLGSAALVVEEIERHDDALARLVDRVEARLRAAQLLLGEVAKRGLEIAAAARSAVATGALGYAVVVARRPA